MYYSIYHPPTFHILYSNKILSQPQRKAKILIIIILHNSLPQYHPPRVKNEDIPSFSSSLYIPPSTPASKQPTNLLHTYYFYYCLYSQWLVGWIDLSSPKRNSSLIAILLHMYGLYRLVTLRRKSFCIYLSPLSLSFVLLLLPLIHPLDPLILKKPTIILINQNKNQFL